MSIQSILILSHLAFFVNCDVVSNKTTDTLQDSGNSIKIKYLTKFLESSLNKTVLDYKLTDLSTPDPHFGATLQLVDVRLAAENAFDKHKSFVLKTSHPKIFQANLQNLKECHFFTVILPALRTSEESAKIPHADRLDLFPKLFGCRLSLNSNGTSADSDYAFLLENLKMENYFNVDSFTIDEHFIILKEMAKFHASFIAMRRLQPDVFNTHVKPLSMPIINRPIFEHLLNSIGEEIDLIPDILAETQDKVKRCLQQGLNIHNESLHSVDNPHQTICHTDLKRGNIMIKRSMKDVTKVKFIDFQMYQYRSYVFDFLLYLLVNVNGDDLKTNFMDYVKFYHSEFYKTIQRFKCPSEDYTYEKVWGEIHRNAKFQLGELLMWKKVVTKLLTEKGLIDQNRSFQLILQDWKFIIEFFDQFGFLDN